MKKLIILISALLLTACAPKGQINTSNGEIVSYSGLGKHDTIAAFASDKQKSCLAHTKEALAYLVDAEAREAQANQVVNSNQSDMAVVATMFARAIETVANAGVKQTEAATLSNENIVAHYQNKNVRYPTQVEMIHAVSRYCNDTNLYDRDIARSASRADFGKTALNTIGNIAKFAIPAWALYKSLDAVGTSNTFNSPNNAVGNDNGVSTPTVVDPVIVNPVIVQPAVMP